jgi:uncharacterized protein (TIGR00369 family)
MAEITQEALEQRINDSFNRQGLMRHLGVSIHSVAPGQVSLRMPFSPDLTQQHGYFHAGGTSALADTAGGYAGYTLFPANSSVLTIEFKINLLAPAQGDYLLAEGKVIRSGRTLTICQIDVYGVSGQKRTHVALAQQTLMCMHGKPDVQA